MERFESLPDDLKTALTSEEVDASIQGVAKKHFLHIDQTGELADETGLVMLGLTKTDEYINNLKERLGVQQQKAAEIAKDIDENVLRPIKTSLIKMHDESTEAAEDEESLDREQIMKEIHEHLEDVGGALTIDDKQQPGTTGQEPLTINGDPLTPKPTGEIPSNVTTTPPAPASIVEKKLTETVKIPKEETIIDRTKNRYGSQDPYREPIE